MLQHKIIGISECRDSSAYAERSLWDLFCGFPMGISEYTVTSRERMMALRRRLLRRIAWRLKHASDQPNLFNVL